MNRLTAPTIEVNVREIPKDKDGFWDDPTDEMYNSLPLLVFRGNEIEQPIVDEDNFAEWACDFNKDVYKYYIRLSDIKLTYNE